VKRSRTAAKPAERVIFSLLADGSLVPGPGVDPVIAAAAWSLMQAHEEGARQRARPGASAKAQKARAEAAAHLPRVVEMVRAKEPAKVIASRLKLSPRTVSRLKLAARAQGLLP